MSAGDARKKTLKGAHAVGQLQAHARRDAPRTAEGADNGCHLLHWDCDAYQYELLPYKVDVEDTETTATTLSRPRRRL